MIQARTAYSQKIFVLKKNTLLLQVGFFIWPHIFRLLPFLEIMFGEDNGRKIELGIGNLSVFFVWQILPRESLKHKPIVIIEPTERKEDGKDNPP